MKTIKIFVLLISLLFTNACDYLELRNVSFVVGMAIDKTTDGYAVNFEVIYSTEETAMEYTIYQSSGKTFLDCIANISKMSSGMLDYNHNKIIIISEELAYEGIDYIIDSLYKNSTFKNNVLILVSKDYSAKDIIKSHSATNKSLSSEIFLALDTSNKNFPKSRRVTLHEFYALQHTPQTSLLLPSITLQSVDGEDFISLEGAGVFKNSKLIDFIDGENLQKISIVDNFSRGNVIVSQIGDTYIGVCIVKNSSNKKFYPNDKKIKIDVNLEVSFKDFYPNNLLIDEMLQQIKEYLQIQFLQLHLDNINLDLYNIKNYIYLNHYQYYKKIYNFDFYLHSLKVIFDVNVKLHDQGVTTYE